MGSDKRRRAEKAGRRGELWAAIYYRFRGYRILKTRYKTKVGEIDLIARKRDIIVFIEVKHRKTLDAGIYSVSDNQTRRIDAAADIFMANLRGSDALQRRNDIVITGAKFMPHCVFDAWR